MAEVKGAGIKRARGRERDVPANGGYNEAARIVIGSNPDPGVGGRAARCAAAAKDLDNDHAAAAAGAWQAMIGRDVRIGWVARLRWIDGRRRGGDQLSGARHVGLAAGAGQQPVVANAMEALRQNVEQEAPDELIGGERHGAVPHPPVAAVVLVPEGDAALVEGDEATV